MEIVLLADDLIVWTQALLLDGELAKAEPKRLRYRLLHVAGRLAFSRTPREAASPTRVALGQRAARRLHEAETRPPPSPADTNRQPTPPPSRPPGRRRTAATRKRANQPSVLFRPMASHSTTTSIDGHGHTTHHQQRVCSHLRPPTARSGLGAPSQAAASLRRSSDRRRCINRRPDTLLAFDGVLFNRHIAKATSPTHESAALEPTRLSPPSIATVTTTRSPFVQRDNADPGELPARNPCHSISAGPSAAGAYFWAIGAARDSAVGAVRRHLGDQHRRPARTTASIRALARRLQARDASLMARGRARKPTGSSCVHGGASALPARPLDRRRPTVFGIRIVVSATVPYEQSRRLRLPASRPPEVAQRISRLLSLDPPFDAGGSVRVLSLKCPPEQGFYSSRMGGCGPVRRSPIWCMTVRTFLPGRRAWIRSRSVRRAAAGQRRWLAADGVARGAVGDRGDGERAVWLDPGLPARRCRAAR